MSVGNGHQSSPRDSEKRRDSIAMARRLPCFHSTDIPTTLGQQTASEPHQDLI